MVITCCVYCHEFGQVWMWVTETRTCSDDYLLLQILQMVIGLVKPGYVGGGVKDF